MPGEVKRVRFFVMMAVAAFIACGVTAFYTQRAEHGRTVEIGGRRPLLQLIRLWLQRLPSTFFTYNSG
jgi:hypothetical protein